MQPACATSGCHSRRSQLSDLALDDVAGGYAALAKRGMIVPGSADLSSHRLAAILHGYQGQLMPPDEPLAPEDLRLVEAWLAAGAQNN